MLFVCILLPFILCHLNGLSSTCAKLFQTCDPHNVVDQVVMYLPYVIDQVVRYFGLVLMFNSHLMQVFIKSNVI